MHTDQKGKIMSLNEESFILTNVLPNTDDYSWKELNCLYKPFSIALKSIEKNYFDLFLYFLSCYMIYVIASDRLIYNRNHVFFEFFNLEMKDLFSANIKIINNLNKMDFFNNLETEIKNNNVVICPVDLYAQPISSLYMEDHQRHFTIVKGYDSKKKIFYILDTTQVELGAGTIYKDFMIEYNRLYEMVKTFVSFYDNFEETYFWSLEKIDTNFNYIEKCISHAVKYNDIIRNLNYKCLELDLVYKLKNNHFIDQIEQDVRLMNMRVVYYKSMIYFCEIVGCINLNKIKFESEELINEWNRIKKLLIYKSKKSDINVVDLEENICQVIEKDKFLMEFVNIELKNNNRVHKNRINNYIIINNQTALINFNSDEINIKLENNKIYDMWHAKNDACQIFFNFNNVNRIDFKVSVNVEVDFIANCHVGIIIIFDNDLKLLYGNMEGDKIGIIAPEKIENYELYYKDHNLKDEFALQIIEVDQKFIFYIENSVLEKVYEIDNINRIKKVGVFAKTWEQCDCIVSFKNILINGEKRVFNHI